MFIPHGENRCKWYIWVNYTLYTIHIYYGTIVPTFKFCDDNEYDVTLLYYT